jgi:hypothetical protein
MRKPVVVGILGLALLTAACQQATVTTEVTEPSTTATTATATANASVADTGVANTAPANAVDPCGLITRDEAAALFGKAAIDPKPAGTACHYDSADQTKFFDLTVKTGTALDFEGVKALCDEGATPVAGLGAMSCSANNTVVALKNGILITLIAGGAFDQAQLQRLAVTATDRIP